MKTEHKIILGSLILFGLQFGLSSCVADAEVGTGVYYGGHRAPWFHDDSWVDGHRWHGGARAVPNAGFYIHPPRGRR
jgi:hypothetical protein